jgi:1-acyl-sn-glycerol-3-phosphate acyltransferase
MSSSVKIEKHGPIFRQIKRLVSLFKKKPIIFNMNDSLSDQAIYISNHSSASGPMILSLYFPILFVPWGAYPMTEGYKSRWNYLYYIFYRTKLRYPKIKSLILSTLFALVSRLLYKGIHLIPSYPDKRVAKTINQSILHLKYRNPILIFPEDSTDGYHSSLVKYNSGFVYLASQFYKETQIELPVYPVYYDKETNSLLIEKPHYINDDRYKGFNRKEIAEAFRIYTNSMREVLLHYVENIQ